jgi:hypothetical protein
MKDEMNDLKEPGKVCWYVKRSAKKRGVLIDMTSQKLSFIFHRNAVKKWSFLLEISAVSFNITT